MIGSGKAQEAAEKVVHKSDNQNKEFFRYVFHRDLDDPSLYDLCVNPGKIGIERASQTIVETAGYPELNECNIYALDAIERLSQTKRIEASLSELDLKPLGLVVEVPEKGVVQISEILLNHEDKERILKVVRGIPSVERVDMDVMVMPTEYG
jgi:hypothetical protein